jgi:hypothetical protein
MIHRLCLLSRLKGSIDPVDIALQFAFLIIAECGARHGGLNVLYEQPNCLPLCLCALSESDALTAQKSNATVTD